MDHAFHTSILVNICSSLDLRDLISFSQTSKLCSKILNLDVVWWNLIASSGFLSPFINQQKPEKSESKEFVKKTFCLYKEIKENMMKIANKLCYLEYFKVKKSEISFLSPNKKRINSLNQTIKGAYGSIPLSYFLLYYIMNGQLNIDCTQTIYNISLPKAFFGGFSYYYDYYEFLFLPLETNLCDFLKDVKFHPFAKENHNYFLFVDFGGVLGFGPEAIFSILSKHTSPDGLIYTIYLVSESLVKFLKEISQYTYDSNEEKLYLDHFNTLNRPDSDETTKGIRVRAKALFNPWDQRAEGKHFFPYQIRISDNGVQKPFRLISRKWTIKDGVNVENVEGEGVIGKFPLIFPGCDDFVYESVSMIGGYEGRMEGSFRFKAEDGSNEVIEAKVGEYLFRIPEGSRILNLNLEKKTVSLVA